MVILLLSDYVRFCDYLYLVHHVHIVTKNQIQYRVTIPLVQNLPLTSEQKFRLGLSWPGQVKTELVFGSQQEVLNKWNGHPVLKHNLCLDVNKNLGNNLNGHPVLKRNFYFAVNRT